MIRLENVSKQYEKITAVDSVSFEVLEGETVVLLGTSGCGKTTTLRMINRLIEPSAGNIIVNGKNIMEQQSEELRRGIGYVLQHHGLFPHYTIAENIAVVPKLLKWNKSKIKQRTEELISKLQLPESLLTSYPHNLSGGQQQRVGVARALAADPPVLLMDEPFGALDPVTRSGIRKEFSELDELRRKTVVLVTHDVQEAFELGDRICLMDKGKIVQIGKQEDLLFKPVNNFVSQFLGNQSFQLELSNISLSDLWSLLPMAISGVDEKVISTNTNVWDGLVLLSGEKKAQRFVSIKGDERKQVDAGSLMAAFAQYKKALYHE